MASPYYRRSFQLGNATFVYKGGKNLGLSYLIGEAPKYFLKFGKIHTHLAVDVEFPRNVDVIDNVLAKLPHIKFLEFHQLSMETKDDKLEVEQFLMPKLYTISFLGLRGGVNKPILTVITNSAPSLENIEHVRLELVQTIRGIRGKVELV